MWTYNFTIPSSSHFQSVFHTSKQMQESSASLLFWREAFDRFRSLVRLWWMVHWDISSSSLGSNFFLCSSQDLQALEAILNHLIVEKCSVCLAISLRDTFFPNQGGNCGLLHIWNHLANILKTKKNLWMWKGRNWCWVCHTPTQDHTSKSTSDEPYAMTSMWPHQAMWIARNVNKIMLGHKAATLTDAHGCVGGWAHFLWTLQMGGISTHHPAHLSTNFVSEL